MTTEGRKLCQGSTTGRFVKSQEEGIVKVRRNDRERVEGREICKYIESRTRSVETTER